MKLPIFFKAYDNGYSIAMGISISLGVSALLAGLSEEETGLVLFGVIGIILFFVFKYLNYTCAKKLEEENLKYYLQYSQKDVDDVLKDEKMTDNEKVAKLIKLAEKDNIFAKAVLKELAKNMEE